MGSVEAEEAVGIMATSSACPVGRLLSSDDGVSELSEDQ